MAIEPTEELFDLLNRGVARELQVAVQYMLQHFKMEKILRRVKLENIILDKTTYDAIGELLRKIAIEEMKHAAHIMERIYYLNGEATTKSAKPMIGETMKDFMANGLHAEEEALDLYRKTLQLTESMGDYTTNELFRDIYEDEEKHYFAFQEHLNIDDAEPEGPPHEETENPKIFTPEYFELLNKAVAAEISAIVQYTNQHEKAAKIALREMVVPLETIKDKTKAGEVSEILKKIFMQEMNHLEKIGERIYKVKGECVYNPDPLPEVGDNADDFLRLDHKAEDYAIVLYRQIIAEAITRGDTKTRKIFEDIVVEEEEHYWTFDDFF
jgi:bacterioferritin